MPNPDNSILIIYNQTITSIVDLLQAYHQYIEEEERTTDTVSAPIARIYSEFFYFFVMRKVVL